MDNSQIIKIGRKYFPTATDEQILQVWDEIQSKDPNITPEEVVKMLPSIKKGIEEKIGVSIDDLANSENTSNSDVEGKLSALKSIGA